MRMREGVHAGGAAAKHAGGQEAQAQSVARECAMQQA